MKLLLLLIIVALTAPSSPDPPFVCDVSALTPLTRKRQFDELGPALRVRKTSIRELQDGFEFEFPSDAATFQLVAEWVSNERLCCPFFDFGMHFERDGGSLWLRLTGREGIKQFIRSDLARWFEN